MYNRLKASTLIETLVALVIIMIAFGAGMMIYTQVLGAELREQRLKGAEIANSILINAEKSRQLADEQIESDGLVIQKEVKKYSSDQSLLMVSVIVKNKQGKSLVKKKRLIYRP